MRDVPLVTHADRTFVALRDAIVDGRIAPGSKLSEQELAARHGVSRAVVREALNRLVACRLAERRANVGARVVRLTADSLVALYQVREALEGMAARLAALNMTDEEIRALHALLDAHQANCLKAGETYYQEAGDVDFHYRIVVGSKNEQLISLLMDDTYHRVRMYRVQLGMAGPRVTTAFDEHRHVARAIAQRDAELAEMLMRRHIQYTCNTLLQRIQSETPDE